jgi:hypothetical protein
MPHLFYVLNNSYKYINLIREILIDNTSFTAYNNKEDRLKDKLICIQLIEDYITYTNLIY